MHDPMDAPARQSLMAAVIYDDGPSFDSFVQALAGNLRDRGHVLAGAVQINQRRHDSRHCDMILEDLATGRTIQISETRGEGASGCRLNVSALLEVCMVIRQSLSQKTDFLLINKFGKMEMEGGGLRDVVAEALAYDIPVLIGVPQRNKAAWQEFCGEHAEFLPPDMAAVCLWAVKAMALQRGSR